MSLTKYTFTKENKQPLNSKTKNFKCLASCLENAEVLFRHRHSYIWVCNNIEVYAGSELIKTISKCADRRLTKSENKDYKYK